MKFSSKHDIFFDKNMYDILYLVWCAGRCLFKEQNFMRHVRESIRFKARPDVRSSAVAFWSASLFGINKTHGLTTLIPDPSRVQCFPYNMLMWICFCLALLGLIQPLLLNTLIPIQNGGRFADDISKLILFDEKVCILIQICSHRSIQ